MAGNALRYKLYKLLSCGVYAIPFSILFALQPELYMSFNQSATVGVGLSFWGYVIVCFLVLGFKNKFSDIVKKNPVLTIGIVTFIIAFIMEFIARQLMLISGATIAGATVSRFVDNVADVYYAKSYQVMGEKKVRIYEPLLSNKNAWRMAFGFREV